MATRVVAPLPKLVQLDEFGREVPDPNPVAVPAGFQVPETLDEQIRRLVRGAVSQQAQEQGLETFEESEDFDIDDDMFDPSSPYEEVFDPVLGRGITLDEFRRNEEVYRRRYLEAEQRAYEEMERSNALRAVPKADAPGAPSSGPQAAPPPSPPDGK